MGAIALGWFENAPRERIATADLVMALCSLIVAFYLITVYSTAARNSVGTPFVPISVAFAATAGVALILELTRRVAGLALVIIAGVFLIYTFAAHLLPGTLAVDKPCTRQRFFGHVYSDAGIIGPTTAVSSTYIILFIIFAAFLQASKVGDYFVNFAFAAAGRARGGPALVGVFFLSSGMQGWFMGGRTVWFLRIGLVVAALFLIEGGLITDVIGLGVAVAVFFVRKVFHPSPDTQFDVRGAD